MESGRVNARKSKQQTRVKVRSYYQSKEGLMNVNNRAKKGVTVRVNGMGYGQQG